MPRRDRLSVLSALLDDGVVPTFTAPDLDTGWAAVRACHAGGARVIELTHRGDDTWPVFVELRRRAAAALPDVILGAGTIVDAPTAALFIAAGAELIVGHAFVPEVARLCNRRRVAYIPGCGSATEIGDAEEAGCEIVKLFPAAALDGPAFVRALLGPSPLTRVMPTNIDPAEASVRRWIDGGAAVLGVGPLLLDPALLARRDEPEIAARVANLLALVSDARGARGARAARAARTA